MHESLDSLDPPVVLTAVCSTKKKAYASLVDYCRKDWDDCAEEMPANDNDLITEYFENRPDFDNYTIETQELDDSNRWEGVIAYFKEQKKY